MDQRGDHMEINFKYFQIQEWTIDENSSFV